MFMGSRSSEKFTRAILFVVNGSVESVLRNSGSRNATEGGDVAFDLLREFRVVYRKPSFVFTIYLRFVQRYNALGDTEQRPHSSVLFPSLQQVAQLCRPILSQK